MTTDRAAAVTMALTLAACGAVQPRGASSATASAEARRAEAPVRRPPPTPTPPAGFVVATVRAVVATPDGAALLLTDASGTHVVPVGIGSSEAMVIDLRLRGEHFERPLTHDLLDSAIAALGGSIVMVQVNKLRSSVFVATVHVWDGREMHALDARTSDAVAVALGHHAPIYVAQAVFDQAGLAADLPPAPPVL